MSKLNDTVINIKKSEMLLTLTWKNDEKNLSRSSFIFSFNDIIKFFNFLRFKNKNCDNFLSAWLLIWTHFAKHQINFKVSFNSCIYDQKYVHFISLMTLFYNYCVLDTHFRSHTCFVFFKRFAVFLTFYNLWAVLILEVLCSF